MMEFDVFLGKEDEELENNVYICNVLSSFCLSVGGYQVRT